VHREQTRQRCRGDDDETHRLLPVGAKVH
jgi:hypothetical protein